MERKLKSFSSIKRNIESGKLMTTSTNRRKTAEIRAVANSSSSFEEKKAAVKEILKYGDVPILYLPHKDSLKPLMEPGLSTLIENAMTEQEVNNLLKKGELDYKNVSSKTLKKWKKLAIKRINELKK